MSNESADAAFVGAVRESPGALSHPSVLVTDVTQQFGTVPALGDVNLAVRPGEFVCVVGPSGCGKTSLLRILAGLAQPTSGTVQIAGRVATVFQGQSLFPWLTAVDNVAYGLQLAGMPTAR